MEQIITPPVSLIKVLPLCRAKGNRESNSMRMALSFPHGNSKGQGTHLSWWSNQPPTLVSKSIQFRIWPSKQASYLSITPPLWWIPFTHLMCSFQIPIFKTWLFPRCNLSLIANWNFKIFCYKFPPRSRNRARSFSPRQRVQSRTATSFRTQKSGLYSWRFKRLFLSTLVRVWNSQRRRRISSKLDKRIDSDSSGAAVQTSDILDHSLGLKEYTI